MILIQAFRTAYKELKAARREARIRDVLTTGPVSIEMLKKIAVDTNRGFEIHLPDGTFFRFDRTNSIVENDTENDGWGV